MLAFSHFSVELLYNNFSDVSVHGLVNASLFPCNYLLSLNSVYVAD